MRPDKLTERLFAMDDAAWARHASAWSVFPRAMLGLPLLLGAIWSRVWLDWWAAAVFAVVVAWLWANPRLAEPPARTDTWWAKATFGERVWLARDTVPIPERHAKMALILSLVSGLGFGAALFGAAVLSPWLTIVGGVVSWFAKMWFVDRMVWLYEDMKDATPEYRSWLKTG